MITLPSSILLELHKLNRDGSTIYLLEIPEHSIRLARNTEDVVWDGHTWQKSWFEIETLTEGTAGEVPELFVYTSNIGGLMEAEVLAHDDFQGSTCILYFVNSNCLTETTPLFSATFQIMKPVCNSKTVGLKLSVDNPYLQAFPLWRLHGSLCQYPTFNPDITSPFHDPRCGYTGATTTCDRTLTACLALSNQTRFGGVLGLFKEVQDV
jgi:hypothetical protein